MPIKIETIENSSEMKALRITLNKLNQDTLRLVADSKNSAHGLKRAAAINEKLKSALIFENNASNYSGRRK